MMIKILKYFDYEAAGYCDSCGMEVYDGDRIYIIDGFIICEECFADFAAEYFSHCKTFGETLRRRINVT